MATEHGVLYQGGVWARSRGRRLGEVAILKDPAGIELIVTPDRIAVLPRTSFVRLLVRSERLVWQPSDCTVKVGQVGWLRSSLFKNDYCIVLSPNRDRRTRSVEVRPADGDLGRVWTALLKAGVAATSPPPP